ncbi:MAG: hypothetical protein ACRDRN_20670 [Sciscionella sp.]
MAAYRADVESDLSAIHHIPDPTALDGPRMLRLAYRLAHYPGILRNRMLGAARSQPTTAPAPGQATEQGEEIRWVPSTPTAIAASPLSRYITTTTLGGTDER